MRRERPMRKMEGEVMRVLAALDAHPAAWGTWVVHLELIGAMNLAHALGLVSRRTLQQKPQALLDRLHQRGYVAMQINARATPVTFRVRCTNEGWEEIVKRGWSVNGGWNGSIVKGS